MNLETRQGRALAELRRGFLDVLGGAAGQATVLVSIEVVRRWLAIASAVLGENTEPEAPLPRIGARWEQLGATDLVRQVQAIQATLHRCRLHAANRNEVAAEVGRLEYLVEDRIARRQSVDPVASKNWREDFAALKAAVWDALRSIEPVDET